MAETREARLRKVARERGFDLEKVGSKCRPVDGETGTQVAGDWVTGGGLNLDQIEAAL